MRVNSKHWKVEFEILVEEKAYERLKSELENTLFKYRTLNIKIEFSLTYNMEVFICALNNPIKYNPPLPPTHAEKKKKEK